MRVVGLTPLAAAGLVGVMIGAAITELSLGYADKAVAPVVLGALSAFVAWGRWKKVPIAPRD